MTIACSHRITLVAALLSAPPGEPGWRNLDVTPNVEYSPKGWLDVVADTTIGLTRQTDDLDSTEVTPRLGLSTARPASRRRREPL